MAGPGSRAKQQRRDRVSIPELPLLNDVLTVCRYKKAYDSMKACPLQFQHPSQAQQLNGLGPKLCDRLTDKLKAHCDENGLPMPAPPEKGWYLRL